MFKKYTKMIKREEVKSTPCKGTAGPTWSCGWLRAHGWSSGMHRQQRNAWGGGMHTARRLLSLACRLGPQLAAGRKIARPSVSPLLDVAGTVQDADLTGATMKGDEVPVA